MSAFIPTDFTRQSKDTKERLDKFFRIVAREEAMRIIEEMRSIVEEGKYFEKLTDRQLELLRVLETVPEYVNDNHQENADGVRYAKSLISDFRPEYTAEIEEALDKYEDYAYMLRSIDDINRTIDGEFMEELNRIFCEYKSSTDHMTRLVKRLLKYNFGYKDDDMQGATTRLLILKQFINKFGYDCTGIKCSALKRFVNEKYDGVVDKIDDSIFGLISQPGATQAETGVLFSDDYINSLTKLHDTIRIKAPLIYVTKEICSKLCDVMNADVLSEAALNGTAILLSDCFKQSTPYYTIDITNIKDYYKLESTEKLDELNELLRKRYSRGYFLYTDFSYSVRLYTLLKDFGDEILILRKKSSDKLLKDLYPDAFMNTPLETGQKNKISSVFSPGKMKYKDFSEYKDAEEYIKLVKMLEKALLDTCTGKEKKELKKRYAGALGKEHEKITGEKAGQPITFVDYPHIFRLMVLAQEYADIIPLTQKNTELLFAACPTNTFKQVAVPHFLSDLVDDNALNQIKSATGEMLANNNEALGQFVAYAEEHVKNKTKYTSKLRDRIESRYNNASRSGSGSDFIRNRNVLYSSKAQKAHDYILLKIADDLANAAFSSQGKTREYLYIFAIAFDIRPIENADPQRVCDIEKNLFWDYYTDNIINNLPSVAGFGDKSDVMIDGYGINYKNFGEVIFLWCLAQPDMTAKERLTTAYEIIAYCREHGKTEEEFGETVEDYQDFMTVRYKTDFEYAKALSKESFTEYVIKNYPCKSNNSGIMQINGEQLTAADVIAEQEAVVNELLEKVERTVGLPEVTVSDIERELTNEDLLNFFYEYCVLTSGKCRNCPKHSTSRFPNCSKYFEPFKLQSKSKNESGEITFKDCGQYYSYYLSSLNDKDWKRRKAEFLELKSPRFVSPKERFEMSFSRVDELCDENQEQLSLLLNRIKKRIQVETGKEIRFTDISRSTVMAVCFYQFVLINWLKRAADISTCFGNFEKFYDIFVNGDVFTVELDYTDDMYVGAEEMTKETICYAGANKILEEAGYAPVNCKNIFDIYLIYIAYRDNFLPLYTDPITEFTDKYRELYAQFEKIKTERKIGEK